MDIINMAVSRKAKNGTTLWLKNNTTQGIFLQGSTLACCWDTWAVLFIKAISSTARECIKKTLETLQLWWERYPGSQELRKTTKPHSTTNLTQGSYWERYKRVSSHPQSLHWERSIKELSRNQGFHGISWWGRGLLIFPEWPEIGGILWPDLWVSLGTSGALSSNLGLFLCRTEFSHLYLKPMGSHTQGNAFQWAYRHNGMFFTTKRNEVILFVGKFMSRETIISSNFKPHKDYMLSLIYAS